MRRPPDVRVLVSVKVHECVVDPILQSLGAAIADDVQDSLSDPCVLIMNEFEHPLPEDLDVLLNLARAELLDRLKPHIRIYGVSIAENDVNVISFPANAHQLPLVWFQGFVLVLLSVVLALSHSNHALKYYENRDF